MLNELAGAAETDPVIHGALTAIQHIVRGDSDGAANHVSDLVQDNPDAVVPRLWVIWSQVIVEGRRRAGKAVLPLPTVPGQEASTGDAEHAVTLVSDDNFGGVEELYQALLWDGMDAVVGVSIILMKVAAMAYSQARRTGAM